MVDIAVDTLGHLLALTVTSADQGDREQVAALAQEVQQVTGGTVELAYVDQGYTGPECCRSRPTARPAARSGQASHGKTRLRAAATPLGRRAQLRLGRTLPPTRKRLRKARHHTQRSSSARLRNPHAPQSRRYSQVKFLTGSSELSSGLRRCHIVRTTRNCALPLIIRA